MEVCHIGKHLEKKTPNVKIANTCTLACVVRDGKFGSGTVEKRDSVACLAIDLLQVQNFPIP